MSDIVRRLTEHRSADGEQGQGLAEYALILGLIAFLVWLAMKFGGASLAEASEWAVLGLGLAVFEYLHEDVGRHTLVGGRKPVNPVSVALAADHAGQTGPTDQREDDGDAKIDPTREATGQMALPKCPAYH